MKKGGLSLLHISSHAPPFIPPKFAPKLGRIKAAAAGSVTEAEIRVCINKPCRRQGSMETLQILSGIAPPHVAVNSCGCLGRCGAGPNIVILPPPATFVRYCGTPARAADVMASICGDESGSWIKSLEALALRKRADDEMSKGNFSQAELLLTQAVDLKPLGGIHIIYRDRSVVRLKMFNIAGAFQDAKEALTLAPESPEAYVCLGDTFMAMEQFDEAGNSYSMALELDPSIRRSQSFKARILKLQEKLAAVNCPGSSSVAGVIEA